MYAFENKTLVAAPISWMQPDPTPLRTANLRAPGDLARCFASETFLDHVASELGADPVELRRRYLTGNTRATSVLEAATQRAGWQPGDISVQLSLIPRKEPVIHGKNGVSQKAEGKGRASHYYSFTRLEAKGRLQLGKRHVSVTGTAWMDHEFGSNQLDEDQVGWDWLSLQLSDGRELMLYLMRKNNGTLDPHSSGTIVSKDGGTRHLPQSSFRMEATGKWESSRSGAVYPMGWRVWVPGEDMELTIRPIIQDQEMETSGSTRVTYWEGGVTAKGISGGHPVSGVGFVEMTG